MPLSRVVSQRRLKRFSTLERLLRELLELFQGFEADLLEEIQRGAPIEAGELEVAILDGRLIVR